MIPRIGRYQSAEGGDKREASTFNPFFLFSFLTCDVEVIALLLIRYSSKGKEELSTE